MLKIFAWDDILARMFIIHMLLTTCGQRRQSKLRPKCVAKSSLWAGKSFCFTLLSMTILLW